MSSEELRVVLSKQFSSKEFHLFPYLKGTKNNQKTLFLHWQNLGLVVGWIGTLPLAGVISLFQTKMHVAFFREIPQCCESLVHSIKAILGTKGGKWWTVQLRNLELTPVMITIIEWTKRSRYTSLKCHSLFVQFAIFMILWHDHYSSFYSQEYDRGIESMQKERIGIKLLTPCNRNSLILFITDSK